MQMDYSNTQRICNK